VRARRHGDGVSAGDLSSGCKYSARLQVSASTDAVQAGRTLAADIGRTVVESQESRRPDRAWPAALRWSQVELVLGEAMHCGGALSHTARNA
jgi:hypothetical protein